MAETVGVYGVDPSRRPAGRRERASRRPAKSPDSTMLCSTLLSPRDRRYGWHRRLLCRARAPPPLPPRRALRPHPLKAQRTRRGARRAQSNQSKQAINEMQEKRLVGARAPRSRSEPTEIFSRSPLTPVSQLKSRHEGVAQRSGIHRQDVGVPTITALTYPPTPAGEPVNVSVEASQPAGRGARRAADGSLRPTALTYKWFLKDREFSEQGASDPSPLAGATGPVLRLDEARCNIFLGCGRYGCSQRVQYHEALAQELMNNGQCMEFSE